MCCLALYFPLLFGTCFPEDDEYWNLLCLLLQIMRIVFSPTINKDQASYLEMLIQHHHEKFKELSQECTVVPKMHSMILYIWQGSFYCNYT